MKKYLSERHHKRKVKGFIKSTTEILTERFMVIVGSQEEIDQLTDQKVVRLINNGSMNHALSPLPNSQQRRKQRKSGSMDTKPKANAARPQPSPRESMDRVSACHRPVCKHSSEMRIRKGRISRGKVRAVLLKGQYFLECVLCRIRSAYPISANAAQRYLR